jgi:hypothetical protein
MGSKRNKIGLGILLVSVCIIIWYDIDAHLRKNRLIELLTQKGTVVLTPSDTEALLADLKSEDPGRLKQWRDYIYLSAGFDSNLVSQVPAATIQEAFADYLAKEKPARSNQFFRLVLALKQQSARLHRNDLLNYLGNPPFTSSSPDSETWQYDYHSYGRDYVASVVVSNDVVLQIEI